MVKRTDEEYKEIVKSGKFLTMDISDMKWIDENVSDEDVPEEPQDPPEEIVTQSFDKRLAYGQETERRFLEKAQALVDKDAYLVEGLVKDHDVVCPNREVTFEVKDQRNARVAVNVEYARSTDKENWRPSAVSTSKATYWVYFAQNKFFVIETQKLKTLIEDKPMKVYPHRNEFYLCRVLYISDLEKECFRVWRG